MKGMPLPFDFQGKLVFDLDLDLIVKNGAAISSYFSDKDCCFGEPTSVLDSAKLPNRPASSSTPSSSLGGGGGGGGAGSTDTVGVAAVSDTNPSPGWPQESATATSSIVGGGDSELFPVPPSLEIGTAPEKFAMEDWESVLSEPLAAVSSPTQEQSILRWIMGDVEDPSMGNLSKALQIGPPTPSDFDFTAGFGTVDQLGFGGDQFGATVTFPNPNRSNPLSPNVHPNFKFPPNSQNPLHPNNLVPIQTSSDETHTPPLFFPIPFPQHPDHHNPPPKRHLPGEPYLHQRPRIHPGDELGQQTIVDHLYKAAELVQSGNPVLAQGILARLNHQLFPVGKPFNRAAFYCKEALQLLLNNNHNPGSSPVTLIFKIGAYKLFSEISPIVQFANFTCNQALLEALEAFDHIHIVDFDIGHGGQWASLMQELALKTGGAPALKITAIATYDHLELGLTRENLIQFAGEINIPFQFEVMSIDLLNSGHFHIPGSEAVAVNLPVGSLANHQLSVPMILSFVKHLSPRIVVSTDRGCDRTDLPFANHIINTLQSYTNLLESIDAGNMNGDAMQKIERLLIQPGIEKIVLGRFRAPEKTQHWRAMFLSLGFSPLTFSNFAESQAECVVKRSPIRGFQVEKRQSSLVLCWQRKELISASVWRC